MFGSAKRLKHSRRTRSGTCISKKSNGLECAGGNSKRKLGGGSGNDLSALRPPGEAEKETETPREREREAQREAKRQIQRERERERARETAPER